MSSAAPHTIALPPRLDASVARAALQTLRHGVAATPAGAVCVLDASAVERFDSAGLALLLACRRQAMQAGASLRVQGWPTQLRALALAYGVLPLLEGQAADAAEEVAEDFPPAARNA